MDCTLVSIFHLAISLLHPESSIQTFTIIDPVKVPVKRLSFVKAKVKVSLGFTCLKPFDITIQENAAHEVIKRKSLSNSFIQSDFETL